MDAATSRTIRLGAVSVGLIGLDQALNRIAALELDEDLAAELLFAEIRDRNYIPPGREEEYRQALRREYRLHLQREEREHPALEVRIFGPGCVSCNNLQTMVMEILDEMRIAAAIDQVHDPDEIGRAGVLHTPALMLNGRLKSAGLLPTRAQVEQWIREIVDA
ncbi:MAG TPA: thioredoxin family protein [Desulfobulbus sp.]|nr:thioredoxin family protein [Desulfobulbus sp.]